MSADPDTQLAIYLFYYVVAIGLSAAGIVTALRFWFRPGAGWVLAGCGLLMGVYLVTSGQLFALLLQSWGVDTAGFGSIVQRSIAAVVFQGVILLANLSATVCLLIGFRRTIKRGRRRRAGKGRVRE